MDVTDGPLVGNLIQIAIPAILQAILSNAYSFNDFIFVGHIKNKQESKDATAALSSAVGIQIILYAFHNLLPAGSTTYISQYYGAKNYNEVCITFKAAFYATIIFSSFLSIIGLFLANKISHLTNSNSDVTSSLESFLFIILMASPAFGIMLLVDGMFKSCGNTKITLYLEALSLFLNTFLNYIFVIQLNYGIRGTAIATALARLIPAMIGLYGIFSNWIQNIDIKLSFMISCSDNNYGNNNSNSNEMELVISRDSYIKANTQELKDDEELESVEELNEKSIAIRIENNNQMSSYRIYLSDMLTRVFEMGKLGLFASFGDFIYGYIFTCMIRYSGLLGSAQQAGLGSAMRGVEWISFCVAEGFLISAITIVGQNIGAGYYERAMNGAILCSCLSAVFTGILGLPFIIFSVQLSTMLSNDKDIIKYSSQYIYINGFVMSCVGFEMASYGALIGAGKAKIIVYVNGMLNISRIFIVSICLTGGIHNKKDFVNVLNAIIWVIGLRNDAPNVNNPNFYCIVLAVACTCLVKALMFAIILTYRYFSKLYFSDCKLIKDNSESVLKDVNYEAEQISLKDSDKL